MSISPNPIAKTASGVPVDVGTSGYYFRDWVGQFYPKGTKTDQMLEYYARHFSVLEVNSTYYGIPKPSVFKKMAEQVPVNFGFYIKVHQDVTHKLENPIPSLKQLHEATTALRDRGLLHGYLAQFPYSFKKNPLATDYLVKIADWFEGKESLFVEFRHTSWYKPVVYQSLTNHKLGLVNVDLPDLPKLPPPSAEVTNGEGYIRFHGRNREAWWGSDGKKRYDYNYSADELQSWKPRIEEMAKKAGRIIIFMNNCFLGQAANNAKMVMDMFPAPGQG